MTKEKKKTLNYCNNAISTKLVNSKVRILKNSQIVNIHNDLTILGDAITSLLDIIEEKFSGTKEVNTI